MPTPPLREMDLFVLAGQSNMQGHGLMRDALPPDERVWCFSSAGRWEQAAEPLHWLWESYTPVHQALMRPSLAAPWKDMTDAELAAMNRTGGTGGTPQVGAGLGLSFARAWASHTGRPVGLIPCAHGGTSLDQWSPALKHRGGQSLYGAMLDRLERCGAADQLRGVLWYQGESDANEHDAPTYCLRMAQWIDALRRDLHRPDLPVHSVQLGRFAADHPATLVHPWDVVRQAQALLPTLVPHTTVVAALDLALSDFIHLDASGLIRLGHRLAQAALDGKGSPRLLRARVAPSLHPSFLDIVLEFDGVRSAWTPARNIQGFTLGTELAAAIPGWVLVEAMRDPLAPERIRLFTIQPAGSAIPGNLHVAYATGPAAYGNAVDQGPACEMALLASAPRPVQPAS